LARTVGKLWERLILEELEEEQDLWHEEAYAGRKGRGAIDRVMRIGELRVNHP